MTSFVISIGLLFGSAYLLGKLSLLKTLKALLTTISFFKDFINDAADKEIFQVDFIGLSPIVTFNNKTLFYFNNKGEMETGNDN